MRYHHWWRGQRFPSGACLRKAAAIGANDQKGYGIVAHGLARLYNDPLLTFAVITSPVATTKSAL